VKCEECLPLIEEYVDGELDGRMAERLSRHLSTCTDCAKEFAAIEREQEIYARYQRDVEVTPADWNIVRARIEQERDAQTNEARTRRPEWFTGATSLRRLFRPSFVAALLLIAVGITASLIYLNSRNRQSELVRQSPEQNKIQTPPEGKRAVTSDKVDDSNATVARDNNDEKDNSKSQIAASTPGDAATDTAKQKRAVVVAASSKRSVNRPLKQPAANEAAQLEEATANNSDLFNNVRRSAPEFTPGFDFEIARHAEKTELLLRSFRNARAATRHRPLDVAYEKEDARKLLYQNIALRRDAVARGDQSAAELLGTLEPILLDIANLPKRVRSRDVRSIEQRMEKKEIIAALQVQTLIASN
jgi:hypothetical protein